MHRGILSTIYVRAKTNVSASDVMNCWNESYAGSPFVFAVDHLPATKHVALTNRVHISVREAEDRLVLICAIDNLYKGASSAAVQNMNVMFGLDESSGLA